MSSFGLNRRHLLLAGAAMSLDMTVPAALRAAPRRGGILTAVLWPAPQTLTAAATTAGTEMLVSAKIFDGLCGYDFDMKPRPLLAESWSISADGLRMTFNLRKGARWHDGKPFTSKDVAFSLLKVWKVLHGRGRSTFADVTDVETPDDTTAIFVLKRPAPAIMKALFSAESQILPAHLYEGTDILQNPFNTKPVGTGPYKFVSFERGDNLVLARNEDYWNKDLPYVDRFVFRFVPDAATRAAMLESNQAQIVPNGLLNAPDITRLGKLPDIELESRGYEHSCGMQLMDFNLDNPHLANIKVRQALAHAIDRNWILRNVWSNFGKAATGPIHVKQTEFYTTEGVPAYPYDIKKAEALLDEAGFKRGAGGIRFSLTIDPLPYGDEPLRAAEYIREQCRRIGITMTVRTQDFGAFVKRVYTDRDFDINIISASTTADPTIGVQRFYWSKNFIKGVAFSNGSHYANPEVDALLEAAQTELDAAKRRDLFVKFQRVAMADLPSLPLVFNDRVTVTRKPLRDHTVGGVGPFDSQSQAWLAA